MARITDGSYPLVTALDADDIALVVEDGLVARANQAAMQLWAGLADFTATSRGAVPNPTATSGRYLKDDGTWAVVPSAVSAVSGVFPFMYSTTATEPPTGSQVRGNVIPFANSTKLWVMNTTVDGLNVSVGLGRIKTGFQVYIQDWTDATKYAIFNVTSDALSKGGNTYWEINVALSSQGAAITAGKVALQSINPAAAGNTVPYTLPTPTVAGILGLPEATNNGTNRVFVTGPALITADYTVTLPATAGTLVTTASPTFTGTVTLPTGLTGVIRADAGVVSTDSDVTDLVATASTTVAGKVELATTAEATAQAASNLAVTPAGLADRVLNVLGVAGIWTGNQAAYDAIGTKSSTTLYVIV